MDAHAGLALGLIATAVGFGFRHGIDWDHIAALTDITGSQESRRRSAVYATLYALGHALVVFLLGVVTIGFAARLPSSVDSVMARFVGLTLVALGLYVIVSLLRHGTQFKMRSRWMLLFSWASAARRRLRRGPDVVTIDHDHDHEHAHGFTVHALHGHPHDDAVVARDVAEHSAVATLQRHTHRHRHSAAMPADPFSEYATKTAFGVGMLHGIGAETPTQVLIFATAAGVTDRFAGVVLLLCFLAGLLVSNSVVALASILGFTSANGNVKVYVGISLLSALFSLVVGTLFVLGRSAVLPPMLGG